MLLALAASVAAQHAIAQGNSPANAFPVHQSITWDAIGTVASRQSQVVALAVLATDDGALLHCACQKMDGHATTSGLWLVSTNSISNGGRVRVSATGLNRVSERQASGTGEQYEISLCPTGMVRVMDSVVRWERPGLTEEYSVSLDGVRQDFVIEHRPPGQGHLRIELALSGAQAEAAAYGAKLIVEGSHRELAYSRLRAVDATGKELSAKMEVVSVGRLALRVEDAGATYPLRVDPTFSDANWVSMFTFPGADNTVFAMIEDKTAGVLYIGGSFKVVGTAVAASVAKWNGSTWLPLGSGLGGTVRSLALDGLGDLYAGGAFTNAVLMATNVAKWNGTNWSALGPGMNGQVLALAADGSGNVYAGGVFTNRTINATNLARWQGSAWSATSLGLNGTVFALCFDGTGNLYAGGNFTTANGTAANYVAKWNGSSWAGLGSGMNSGVHALLVDTSGLVYAGGLFSTAGGNPAANVAFWNGSAWSALGSGVNSEVLALTTDGAGNLYAAGLFSGAGGAGASRIAVWNGSAWSALGLGIDSFVYSVAVDRAGNLFAGGGFTAAGGLAAKNLAEWNGSTWSTFGSGPNASVYVPFVNTVTVDGSGNLYVGGVFTTVGGSPATNVVKWNGNAWSALGSGITGVNNGAVEALTTDGSGSLYAGGNFTNAGGISVNNIAKWNGSAWSALGSGMGGGNPHDVYGLITDGAGNVYAGGSFVTAGGVTVNGIAKWNGSTWSALSSGVTGNSPLVQTLAFDHTGNLYVGGRFNMAGGIIANNIAAWNGSAWSAPGSGVSGSSPYVFALAMDAANHLYVGGTFTTAGGIAITNVAQWDGLSWSALGSGMNNTVNALTFDPGGNLYAGGLFTTAGGVSANYIAKWDGNSWSALGAGMNYVVFSLVSDGAGRLYAGGAFSAAGTNVSAYVAQANVLTMISHPARYADGSFAFDLLTTPNTTNRVLASTNLASLATWQPIYTNVAPANGAWQFIDTNATHYLVRFYRSASP